MSGAPTADTGPQTLPEVRESAFALLSRAVADRRSAMHTVTLGTTGLDGGPRLRTVVLRAFDPASRLLRIHTDLRSPKVAELRHDPRVALLAYDPGRKVQLRVEGIATLHHGDDVAKAAWSTSQPMSRQCYGTLPGPGEAIADGGAFALPWDEDEVAAGEAHFVTVLCRMDRLDWLFLAHGGHRRAAFAWTADVSEPTATWLVP
jgi:hypothetical protein